MSKGNVKQEGPRGPQRPEDLPISLFPYRLQPMSQFDRSEYGKLCTKPQTLHEVPKQFTGAKRKKVANLAQYRGKSEAGRRRSIDNLVRSRSHMDTSLQPATPNPDVPAPNVPMQFAQMVPKGSMQRKSIQAALSVEEYNLYIEKWDAWFADHSEDYDHIEDKDDVHRICMEHVIQWRLQMVQVNHPGSDTTKAYNDSTTRMQKARENLAARRVDRHGTRAKGGDTLNIAILAGKIDQEGRDKITHRDRAAMLDFLDTTTDNISGPLPEPIDVEAEVIE